MSHEENSRDAFHFKRLLIQATLYAGPGTATELKKKSQTDSLLLNVCLPYTTPENTNAFSEENIFIGAIANTQNWPIGFNKCSTRKSDTSKSLTSETAWTINREAFPVTPLIPISTCRHDEVT